LLFRLDAVKSRCGFGRWPSTAGAALAQIQPATSPPATSPP
jgi:hypothetical protein